MNENKYISLTEEFERLVGNYDKNVVDFFKRDYMYNMYKNDTIYHTFRILFNNCLYVLIKNLECFIGSFNYLLDNVEDEAKVEEIEDKSKELINKIKKDIEDLLSDELKIKKIYLLYKLIDDLDSYTNDDFDEYDEEQLNCMYDELNHCKTIEDIEDLINSYI